MTDDAAGNTATDNDSDTSPAAEPAVANPLSTLYRVWNEVYPTAICDTVLDTLHSLDVDPDDLYAPATIVGTDGVPRVTAQRQATTVFLEPAHWIGSLVSHFAHQANLLWQYDLAGLGTVSVVRYTDSGDHFDWHVDSMYTQFHYPELSTLPLERKLSVTINLSDPGDYEGGDLRFLNVFGQEVWQPELRNRGSVIVFPSTVCHKVNPVTAGERYALVGWMVGPRLR